MEELYVRVDGRTLRITHPDKEILPGMSKAELLDYYVNVWPKMSPYLYQRPLTLVRAPEGPSSAFFQKDMRHVPDWIPRWVEGETHYVLCNDLATLVYLANLDTVEFHITLFRAPNKKKPDFILFDLDPHGVGWEDVVLVAKALLKLFKRYNIRYYLKHSGGKGLHILVPSDGRMNFKDARELARRVALLLKSALPDIITLKYSGERRGVLVDYNQNSWVKTVAAPFTLRLSGNVSLPLREEELEELPPLTPEYARRREDLLSGLLQPQDLSRLRAALGL